MKPLVSIIMGVHNESKKIVRCLNSIIEQTYENWELIICDDFSTDDTKQIVEGFSKLDSRIKLIINEKNLGLASTLNKCLQYVNGKYIARLDADDISLKNRIEVQVNFLENNSEYSLVGSAANLCDNEGKIWGKMKFNENPTRLNLVKGVCFIHPSIMARKEMYSDLKGYSGWALRCEDYDLWFRMYEKGYKGFNLTDILYNYYVDKEDYTKRKYKYRFIETKVRIKGYMRLRIPFYYYPYSIKPLIVGLLPNNIMHYFHKKKFA